ncbi:MAG: hypothetical protein LIQ31_14915 [Planctomycetes bacterium]|nr:hypothetical protein [Planctomycetota bacterium]
MSQTPPRDPREIFPIDDPELPPFDADIVAEDIEAGYDIQSNASRQPMSRDHASSVQDEADNMLD